jgi:hypothetical protein
MQPITMASSFVAVLALCASSTLGAHAPSRNLLVSEAPGPAPAPITVPFNSSLQPGRLPLDFTSLEIVRLAVGYQPEQVCTAVQLSILVAFNVACIFNAALPLHLQPSVPCLHCWLSSSQACFEASMHAGCRSTSPTSRRQRSLSPG